MPTVIAALWGGFLAILGSVVGQVLTALAIGVVAYTGIDVSLDWLKAQALVRFQELPQNYLAMLSMLKVGPFINLISSAMLARMTLNGMQSGAVKKWVKL